MSRVIRAATCAFLTLALTLISSDGLAFEAKIVTLNGTFRGTYRVPADTTLQGGKSARIVGQVILAQGSSIRGVEVTGWTDTTWNFSAGIRVAGDNVTIQDNYIHDGASHGIQVIGGHAGTQILDNKIVRVGTYTQTGSSQYPIANWRGISLEEGSHGTRVQGNTITDAWENGIHEYASEGVLIIGNTVKAFNRGLVDSKNAGSGNGIEALSEGTFISGNVVNGGATGSSAIWGRAGIVTTGTGAIIRDNEVSKLRDSGIVVIKGGGEVTIEGNKILTVAQSVGDAAGVTINAYDGLPRVGVVVDGNEIRWVKNGIAVRAGPKGYVDGTTVTQNVLWGNRLLLEGENNVVWGNS